jgi:hypothetical protein
MNASPGLLLGITFRRSVAMEIACLLPREKYSRGLHQGKN